MCAGTGTPTILDLPRPVAHVDADASTVVPAIQTAVDNTLAGDSGPIGIPTCEPGLERFRKLGHEYFVGEAERDTAGQMLVEASQHCFVSVVRRRLPFVDGRIGTDDQLELDQAIDPVKRLHPEAIPPPCLPFPYRIELLRDAAEDHLIQIDHLLLERREALTLGVEAPSAAARMNVVADGQRAQVPLSTAGAWTEGTGDEHPRIENELAFWHASCPVSVYGGRWLVSLFQSSRVRWSFRSEPIRDMRGAGIARRPHGPRRLAGVASRIRTVAPVRRVPPEKGAGAANRAESWRQRYHFTDRTVRATLQGGRYEHREKGHTRSHEWPLPELRRKDRK